MYVCVTIYHLLSFNTGAAPAPAGAGARITGGLGVYPQEAACFGDIWLKKPKFSMFANRPKMLLLFMFFLEEDGRGPGTIFLLRVFINKIIDIVLLFYQAKASSHSGC